MKGSKRISIALAVAVLAAGLTGCAGENQIPEFNQEEVQAIGEFVALTMMKYDMNHRSRLMDLELLDEEEEDREGPSATQAPEEVSGMAPVDDTPVVDSEGRQKEEEAVSYSLAEVMGLPEGMEVTFVGQASYESYPEDGAFFSLNASEGKRLLVLQFSLENSTSEDQPVDMLDSDAVFTITVNEAYSRKALPTILLDDLSTYVGTVPAGKSVEAVLVIEAEKETAEDVSSISLNVKSDGKASTCKVL